MLTKETIMEALHPVIDPELGMSVVDLGMIREVLIDEETGNIEIKMVLTAPFCPLADYLVAQVRNAAAAVSGVGGVQVTLLDEPWNPAWMKQ